MNNSQIDKQCGSRHRNKSREKKFAALIIGNSYFRNSSLARREYRWAITAKTIIKPPAETHLVICKLKPLVSPTIMLINNPARIASISGSRGFISSNMANYTS